MQCGEPALPIRRKQRSRTLSTFCKEPVREQYIMLGNKTLIVFMLYDYAIDCAEKVG